MTRLVLIGGGGHARVLLDILATMPDIALEGYVAPEPGPASDAGLVHLGGDDRRDALAAAGVTGAVLGVAGARGNEHRRALFEAWSTAGFQFPSLRHPRATVSPRASHGAGLQCFPGAVVNAGATLGINVIVNSGALVEHDCRIGDHAHVAPGAILCGGVLVGSGSLIGAGATVLPGVSVGDHVVVGAGSVVCRDVPAGMVVAGAPARCLSPSHE